MSVKLTERLSAAASLVRGGGTLADIGTDHAYLPVYLIEHNIIKSAIAADIVEGPLKNAENTVNEHELSDKIALRLSDGLKSILPDETDEIVFAGMGGTLITEKLKETEWIKSPRYHFIFQPQSRAEELREYLYSNGFCIKRELAVHEGERFYIAFDAEFTGEVYKYKPSDCFIGKLPHTLDAKEHIARQLTRIVKKYDALVKSGETDETRVLSGIINDCKDFLNE